MDAEVDKTSQIQVTSDSTQQMKLKSQQIQINSEKTSFIMAGNQAQEDQYIQQSSHNEHDLLDEGIYQQENEQQLQRKSSYTNKDRLIDQNENEDIYGDSQINYACDINQLSQEYYLQSTRNQVQGLNPEQLVNNNINIRGNLFFSPRDVQSQIQYQYHIPTNIKTEGNEEDLGVQFFNDSFYPQSPPHLSLAQLNSRSFFINSIMKKDSKEFLEKQKEMLGMPQQIIHQKSQKQNENRKVKGNRLMNQQSFDSLKFQNNFEDTQSQYIKNKQQYKRGQLMSNEGHRKQNNYTQKKPSQTQQLVNDNLQILKNIQITNRKANNPNPLIPIQESNTKVQLNSSTKILVNRLPQNQSAHISPSNEMKVQGQDNLFFFGKKNPTQQLSSKTKLPDVSKSLQMTSSQQIALKKSTVQNQLSGILMHQQNNQQTQFNQFQNASSLSQNLSNNSTSTLNTLQSRIPNKQNYILFGKKTKQSSQSISNLNKLSKGTYTEGSIGKSVSNLTHLKKIEPTFESKKSEGNDSDEFNEESENEKQQTNIQQDQKDQKCNDKMEDTFQEYDINLKYKAKSNGQLNKPLSPSLNNQLELIPPQGILTSAKPVESISFYYLNKSPNQTDLISERTNLNAPLDPQLKLNYFDDGKWKIEKSDNMDMEASRSQSSLSPTKHIFGKQSSQQLSPNTFFPSNIGNADRGSSPTQFNLIDNLNLSNTFLEQNKASPIQRQRSSSDDSQMRKDKFNESQQRKSSHEVPAIINEKKQEGGLSQNQIPRKLTIQSQSSSKSLVPQNENQDSKPINRQTSSSISLYVSQQNNANEGKSDKESNESQKANKKQGLIEKSKLAQQSSKKIQNIQNQQTSPIQLPQKERQIQNLQLKTTQQTEDDDQKLSKNLQQPQQQNTLVYIKVTKQDNDIQLNKDNNSVDEGQNRSNNYSDGSDGSKSGSKDSFKINQKSRNSYPQPSIISPSQQKLNKFLNQSQNNNNKIKSQSSSSNIQTSRDSLSEEKNLLNPSLIIQQQIENPFLFEDSTINKELAARSMTTVYEKSEVTSNISIPIQEGCFIGEKRKSSVISQSDQLQIMKNIQEIQQVKRKSVNSEQITQIQQIVSSQNKNYTLSQIKDYDDTYSKQSLDSNINLPITHQELVPKKRSFSDQDILIQGQNNQELPLRITFSQIPQLQSDSLISMSHLKVIGDQDKQKEQQLRTRSETFKGKQDDELQIKIVPPDNSTPQAIRNNLKRQQFNFSELSKSNDNSSNSSNLKGSQKSIFGLGQQINEKNNPSEVITSVQQIQNSMNNNNTMSPQINSVSNLKSFTSVNNASLTAININGTNSNTGVSNLNTGIINSAANTTLNQDEKSQGENNVNIPLINNPLIQFQKQQQQIERDNLNNQIKQSQQQLNIQNPNIHQKLSRSVKSSEDSYIPLQFGVEVESNQKIEQHSHTTKHSFQKGYGNNNDNSISSFNQEQDSPAVNFRAQPISRAFTNSKMIQSNHSLNHEDIQKISKRPSFDGSNSRRSSILTPQQIKQVKKESRFFNRLNFQNKNFFDSEDPMLLNIYGQESNKYVELKGLCQFSDTSPKQQNLFQIDEEMIMNTLICENDDRYQHQLSQPQQRDSKFKKLIYQIEQFKQNPYSENFDQAKVDNMFQKNVKTLFRKINQYFKTKYHYDTSNIEGQRNASRTQISESNQTKKIQQKLSKAIGMTSVDKQIQKDKKPIQNDLAQSEELEYEEVKMNSENIELKKSDIEKLNQKLSKSIKTGMIEKLIISKMDDSVQINLPQKDGSQGIDKQSTMERVNGILRNFKKRQSQKLVIQINPPAEEQAQIQIPHIKLDFSAIKKKNGNTEFILDQNNHQETESLQSSNEDDDENEDDRNIEVFPQNLIAIKEQQKIESNKYFDFLNKSEDSWDENLFNSQNIGVDTNPKILYKNQGQHFDAQSRKLSGKQGHKNSLPNEQVLDQKLSTLNFLNQNSWRFVKNYQITYLEKQIDKGFLQKVSRLQEFLKNLKNKVDPTDCFKLESFITPIYNNFYGGEVFLNREGRSKTIQHQIPSLSETKQSESTDLSQINVIEHKFQKDLVNDCYLDEKKRQNEENSSEESDSFENSRDSSDDEDDEELEMEMYNLLSDQDKDLNDKNQFLYDEEDYEVARSNYLLNKGYLEPTIINESSNMFTQLYEQIVPVLSGIDSEYIYEILKTRGKSDKKVMLEIKQQSQIEKKFRTINKMISHLDFRSSQTDMKNIQSEYNDLLEGDFQDNLKIDHDFYKKEFIKQQQQQFNKFLAHQRNQRRKQLTVIPKKQNADNSVIGNASVTLLPFQRQQIKERSPKSNPDLYEAATTKYKSQDSKSSQYQNFQHSMNHYNQQQQQSGLSTQAGSLQQQQQQFQIQQTQYQQQQHYQQLQLQHQSHTLQQNPVNIHSFIQQNTLPSHTIQYSIIPSSQQQGQNQSSQRIPNPSSEAAIAAPPQLKSLQNKGFTQSLKNFNQGGNGSNNYNSGLPQKTEPSLRTQVTIKNDDDHSQAAKNISKINTPQSYKSDAHQATAMQSGYNKTSTLQSQQSTFNHSESLLNKEGNQIVSQDNSKQAVKSSESQYMLQKINTNQSADENQLTAPSPTQITKKDVRITGRKRSIFNTDNIQQQQFLHQDLNRSYHSPPSLHSPNFPHHNTSLPQYQKQQNANKSINFFQQSQNNGTHSPILPQTQLQHQVSIINHANKQMSFNQSNLGQSNLNSFYSTQQHQNQVLPQQIQSPGMNQQQLQINDLPQTPIRSPNRGGTINYGLMNNLSTINQISSAQHINNQSSGIPNIYQQSTLGSLGYPNSTQTNSQGQVNLPSTPSNLNPSIQLQNNSTKPYPTQPQLESLDSKQVKNNKTFSSLTVKRDLEKSTSMDRQNLVMRTRLQQNLRRSQLDEKDQVFAAIKENNIHEIEDLLNQYHSLSLESKDEEGNTFIVTAAQVGSREIVEYLFQKGADINAQNNDGDTALHKANFYQYHNVADFLIQNGAQQNKMNNNGLNPWGCYPSSSKR